MAKLGRPKGSKNKKRKKREATYKTREAAKLNKLLNKDINEGKYEAFNPSGGDLGRDNTKTKSTTWTHPSGDSITVTESIRAHKNSYVLICGTRIPIQDLSHESLCDRYTLVTNEVSNLRRELNNLQELENNLRAEKFYRNL